MSTSAFPRCNNLSALHKNFQYLTSLISSETPYGSGVLPHYLYYLATCLLVLLPRLLEEEVARTNFSQRICELCCTVSFCLPAPRMAGDGKRRGKITQWWCWAYRPRKLRGMSGSTSYVESSVITSPVCCVLFLICVRSEHRED